MIIGILYLTYDETILAEVKDVINCIKDSACAFTLNDYLDARRSSNLTRFTFDPFTGEKIDWNKIKQELKDACI